MKYSKENPAGGMLLPLEYKNKESKTINKESKHIKESKSTKLDSKTINKDSKHIKESKTLKLDSKTINKESKHPKLDSKSINKESKTKESKNKEFKPNSKEFKNNNLNEFKIKECNNNESKCLNSECECMNKLNREYNSEFKMGNKEYNLNGECKCLNNKECKCLKEPAEFKSSEFKSSHFKYPNCEGEFKNQNNRKIDESKCLENESKIKSVDFKVQKIELEYPNNRKIEESKSKNESKMKNIDPQVQKIEFKCPNNRKIEGIGSQNESKYPENESKMHISEFKYPNNRKIEESDGHIMEFKSSESRSPSRESKMAHNVEFKPLGGVARMVQREKRRNKRKEKENMWKRNNLKNAIQEPIVMHYPARSALQTLHKSSSRAQEAHYFLGGVNHDWVGYYERGVTSDQSCINEWNAMDSLESKRPPSPDSLTDKEETQLLIRSKLKEIMMSVDIDEVTSKYIRQRLEEDLALDLFQFKSYIDQEMLVILGQMDAATEIFPHVYLGSEWNASNLDELQNNGIGYILNVTKEIDNFYPGTFDYLNIRVYDDEKTELLKHWDKTFKYISQVKEKESRVLVHCKMGISRSASVVIAYAMKAFNMSLDEALQLVKKKRSCIKPNQAFCSQLKTYEGILDASRQRHNILWRSKSETNLKSVLGNANRPNKNTGGEQRTGRSGGGNRRKESIHKSTEELSMCDATYSHHTHLPTPSIHITHHHHHHNNRRPKSWSPDEHTADLHFPNNNNNNNGNNNEQGVGELSDTWRLSQSLNVQAWSAHVTLEHRNKTPVDDNNSGVLDTASQPQVIEALNPLYADSNPESEGSLQLSSSVKDRINEFESVQTAAKKSPGSKSMEIQNTVTSSDDFENGKPRTENNGSFKNDNCGKGENCGVPKNENGGYRSENPGLQNQNSGPYRSENTISFKNENSANITGVKMENPGVKNENSGGFHGLKNENENKNNMSSSTAELDKVIETLLGQPEDLQGSDPVISQTKQAAQRHQAILVPSQIWSDEKGVERSVSERSMSVGSERSAGVERSPSERSFERSSSFGVGSERSGGIERSPSERSGSFGVERSPSERLFGVERSGSFGVERSERSSSFGVERSGSERSVGIERERSASERSFGVERSASERSVGVERSGSVGERSSEVSENESPSILKDSILWPSGIVKKQKQDFEEKVKMGDAKTKEIKESSPKEISLSRQNSSKEISLSRQNSSKEIREMKESPKEITVSLSRQNSSASLSNPHQVEIIRSPSYGRHDTIDTVKTNDPFSAKLDKVFDREERKQERLSAIFTGEKDTPSRNSSWGSFDSAVVLADRDLPSRQSSWGSCDTRGTAASRNSSFGQFDVKPILREEREVRSGLTGPNSSLTGPNSPLTGPNSPLTISNSGQISPNVSLTGSNSQTGPNFSLTGPNSSLTGPNSPLTGPNSPLTVSNSQTTPNSNITGTYFEKEGDPFSPATIRRNKVKTEREEEDKEEENEANKTASSDVSNASNVRGYRAYRSPSESTGLPDEKMEVEEGGVGSCRVNNKLNICIPDSSVQIQTQQPSQIQTFKIEGCTETKNAGNTKNSAEKIADRGARSPDTSTAEQIPLPGTVRQHREFLESMYDTPEVRRPSERLYPQAYTRSHSSGDLEPDRGESLVSVPVLRSFSEKRAKFEETEATSGNSKISSVKKITQAFEKQNDDSARFSIRGVRKRSHSLERLSTSPSSPGSYSREILDQLILQKENENQEMQEISQELSQETSSPSEEICVKNLVGIFEDTKEERVVRPPRVQTRSVRAKSDSCTPDKFLPPVPQRKSSLDYNFKPIQRAQSQPPQTPPRTSTPGGSLSPMSRPPAHNKPPPGGRGQACGTEVRQRKQQGKSHPLTKLTRTMRENYHTM